ncbi:hypothetical protein [Nonomuraea soli]|uniref:Uncharacterized protein n=1 Tax=Nonomuraea soli TaxID=1032476 RepID=A0A7W0CHL3_9ACTN|nr:hypothetical protein [Nonomuraea soli]MBA2891304.1 hypothetical protein [Nonomuraea soli]
MSETGDAPVPPSAGEAAKEMRATQTTSTIITGPVHLGANSTIGLANGATGVVSYRLSGRVPTRVIEQACTRYARPEPYQQALDTLREERVIVLHAAPGNGRRTGAINLMRGLGGDRVMHMLSADRPFQELAELSFEVEACYLLLNRPADEDTGDVGLSTLVEKIQAAAAHLVITAEHQISTLVSHFSWPRPTPQSLLSVYGVQEVAVGWEVLNEHSMADLVRFAGSRADGIDEQESLAGLDLAHKRRVEDWFAGEPEWRELAEAAALAFLNGLQENRFEHWSSRLRADPEPEDPTEAPRFRQVRKRPESSLIAMVRREAVSDDAIPGQTRRCVEFKSSGFQPHVIAELCEYPDDFWTRVFDWIDEVVDDRDPEVLTQLTYGLALLAEHDFDSVRTRFLQPWSDGERGWRAWTAATYVLSFMCYGDSTEPLARRTALRWSRSKAVLRRCAAASAFGTLVGVLDPGEAMRNLWTLVRDEEIAEAAVAAIAVLYQNLCYAETGANRVVLDSLVAKLRAERNGPASEIALGVLCAADDDGTTSAGHLGRQPQDSQVFGELWALLVTNRPIRTATFANLYTVLDAVKDEEIIRSAVRALRDGLPAGEREPFETQFVRFAQRRDSRRAPTFVALIGEIFNDISGD